MTYTSPDQWALASPTTSSSSRSSQPQVLSEDQSEEASEGDEHEGLETETEAILDHVRQQLTVDVFMAEDNHCGTSFRLNDDAVVEQIESLLGTRDGKGRSNNFKAQENGDFAARERLLETTLVRVLVKLAGEQDNLHLAATAGNALLEELSAARKELEVLHDELEAAQLEWNQAVRETQRLRDENAALETEVHRCNTSSISWDSETQENTLGHLQQQTQQQGSVTVVPSLTPCESFSRTDSCKWCASREVETTELEQCIDELRRRCLELELAAEREQEQQRELMDEITQLRQQSNERRLETVRAQEDLKFVTLQLEQKLQEVESVEAVRDTLHRIARRLEVEKEDLQARLAARDELVEELEINKASAVTQLQASQNRAMNAEAATERAKKTVCQLQKQLEGARDSKEAYVTSCESEARDMEQLLQDATREIAALRIENRVLRRQRSSESRSEGSRIQGGRRRTLGTGVPATTAVDALAPASRELKQHKRASFSSKSTSDIEATISSNFQQILLEIEAVASSTKPTEVLSKSGKEQRKRSLSWVGKTATIVHDTAAVLKEKPSSAPVLSKEEHCTMHVDKNHGGSVLQVGMESFTTTSLVDEHHSALPCPSHVNNHCTNSNVRVSKSDMEKSTGLSAIGDGGKSQVLELPIKDVERKAAEFLPMSSLHVGLSIIACATAATAVGLLVRRYNR
ncbi:unnamed protein product [Peronospora belbahrii]|uniref:Uncharacterized protein n=1 Tax=Peronospora belbahrii TaxID=622444 RepID=A0ABN8D3R5_9STRA|nr:unnamed protein product [Peronospora belbahrii]